MFKPLHQIFNQINYIVKKIKLIQKVINVNYLILFQNLQAIISIFLYLIFMEWYRY